VAPPAPVTSADELPPDYVYPVECDVPCILLASPPGLVNVSESPGPVVVFGRFAGGSGVQEVRTLKGKQVFLVTGVQSRAGDVELLIVPQGATKAADVIRRTVKVKSGTAPHPPPVEPDTTPTPKPKPVEPAPELPAAPDDQTRVLVLFDPDQLKAQTEARKAVLYGADTRNYLKSTLGDNARVYEKGVQFQPGSTSPYRALVVRGIKPGQFGNVIITKGGKIVSETDVPADPATALTLFKKHLGG